MPLIKKLQITSINSHSLIRVASHKIPMTDIIRPGRSAIRLPSKGVTLSRSLRSPGTPKAISYERPKIPPIRTDRLNDHKIFILALDSVNLHRLKKTILAIA